MSDEPSALRIPYNNHPVKCLHGLCVDSQKFNCKEKGIMENDFQVDIIYSHSLIKHNSSTQTDTELSVKLLTIKFLIYGK